MKHRTLIHEVWEDSYADLDETWHTEWGICLAGPLGDWFRRSQSPRARLSATFDAGSLGEAMARFYLLIGPGEKSGCHPLRIKDGLKGLIGDASESEPYPDWFFQDDEQPPCSDPSHPLWDREMDE